jgi:hypothetical protein
MEVFATEMCTFEKKSGGDLLLALIQRTTLDALISNMTQIKYKMCEHSCNTDMQKIISF